MAATFGTELKKWRTVRRLSQLTLGVEAGVSSRHISFMESGRSKPSQEMVIHLAETLDVPKSERNRLLNAAGFASRYVTNDLSSDAMIPIRSALSWTLERHNPYPAIVLGRHWDVIETNQSARALFDLLGQTDDVNMIDWLLGDSGIRDTISNWSEVSTYLLARLKTENAFLGGDSIFEEAIEKLEPLLPNRGALIDPVPNPLVTVELTIGDQSFSMLSSIAQFGAADDFALADLKVELYFPADEPTRELFHSLGACNQ